MFRRRRRDEASAAEVPAATEERTDERSPEAAAGPAGEGAGRGSGPWDEGDDYPERDRVDLGGLRVPIGEGHEVQVNMAEDQVVGVTVIQDQTALQVQAFAAPKRSGIWDEVRRELSEELRSAGAAFEEVEGPFGREVVARVPVDAGEGQVAEQPVRFIGVDGPRWFLRGAISGQGAASPEAAEGVEDVFRDVVVVRGDTPMPPKELIELRLPPDARKAMEQAQAAAEQEQAKFEDLNPFERGPEITEIR
ncbi:DUF3710 domain-containing protein [Bailinhaonella thermotolerans]|uniref:DUF3710 domain-containing protein n=1 Tax=Bailinhaonella thermotolerans TaxID=1070861 RepID=A0A3A4B6Q4_9ACTN|nr:DUF3710 domain-containing protein [Bailinhaonella thermotolerans]RJL34247.1 DUF3710 domain-containing protein [Bailinhaonella thermotolerans]